MSFCCRIISNDTSRSDAFIDPTSWIGMSFSGFTDPYIGVVNYERLR
jgi:hypothetical protein